VNLEKIKNLENLVGSHQPKYICENRNGPVLNKK
jgi:hypothetical protein